MKISRRTTAAQALLRSLESSGKYVFHGSVKTVHILEPRQQMNFNPKQGKLAKDGTPAVCATPFVKIATFRALTSDEGGWTNFGQRNGKIFIRSSPEALQWAKKNIDQGYVYVFSKRDFKRFSFFEVRTQRAIAPLAVVRVTFHDLPAGIQIVKDWPRLRKMGA